MIRAVVLLVAIAAAWQATVPALDLFVAASSADEKAAKAALEKIAVGWKDSYASMFVDMARLMRPPRRPIQQPDAPSPTADDERTVLGPERPSSDPLDVPDRGSPIRRRLIAFLAKQTIAARVCSVTLDAESRLARFGDDDLFGDAPKIRRDNIRLGTESRYLKHRALGSVTRFPDQNRVT